MAGFCTIYYFYLTFTEMSKRPSRLLLFLRGDLKLPSDLQASYYLLEEI